MIRINLLPSGKKKPFVLPATIIYGIIALAAAVIAIGGFTHYLNKQISAKKVDIAAKERKLKELEAALKEVQSLEKENEEFREKTKIIEQLKRNQTVPLRLLDEVSEMLPKGVWLSNLKDKGGVISVEGYAFSNSDLVTYVQNMKNSRYLADVMLVESRQTSLGDFSVYKFNLTFKVKV